MSLPYLILSKSEPISDSRLTYWIESNGIYGSGLAEEILPYIQNLLASEKREDKITTRSGIKFNMVLGDDHLFLSINLQSLDFFSKKTLEELEALRVYAQALNHDLATPLQNIALQAEMISLKGHTDLEIIENSLTHIRESIITSQNILKDLSDFARLTVATEEHCDINDVLVQVRKVLKDEIDIKNAIITYGRFEKIKIQPFRLLIVLKNLLQNSIKYSGAQKPQILIYETLSEDSYTFTVEDNGIGIPEGDKKDIFKPYKRASNVGKVHGSGIGLNTCRSLVRAAGGDIRFKSPLTKTAGQPGTAFHLEFPLDIVVQ